jgi:hypothetical protein
MGELDAGRLARRIASSCKVSTRPTMGELDAGALEPAVLGVVVRIPWTRRGRRVHLGEGSFTFPAKRFAFSYTKNGYLYVYG